MRAGEVDEGGLFDIFVPEAVALQKRAGLYFPSDDETRKVMTYVFYDDLLQLQRDTGVPMLVGAIARVGFTITPSGGVTAFLGASRRHYGRRMRHADLMSPARHRNVPRSRC